MDIYGDIYTEEYSTENFQDVKFNFFFFYLKFIKSYIIIKFNYKYILFVK